MAKNKRETVSASFHYLVRNAKNADSEAKVVPISEVEFDNLCKAIETKPVIDLDDPALKERVMYRLEVPMERPQRINSRTLFGVFRGSYTGHAYHNSARGKIPADSVSLRPFHYLLYLSESGKIYIGAQYLGQFGAYGGLQRTIRDLLPNPAEIVPHSFRASGAFYKDVIPKEVRVTFINNPKSRTDKSTFTQSGVVAFKKARKEDGFEASVAEGIFPLIGKTKSEVRKGMAELLSQSDLMAVSDEDIEDVTVFATVSGGRRTAIHMMDGSAYATRFPLNLDVNADGHPDYNATRNEMLDFLQSEIIDRAERD